ncbi:hypothetical protein ACJMK2_020821 [Sinanodonta woodiana]|uniref:Uncharacterized protein n=1 Tax=Sinanodonta woodiana TaxID=1069815 RepID=A0ABD3U3P9_SINWO
MIADSALTSLRPSEVLLGHDLQLPAPNSSHGLYVERSFRQQKFCDTFSPSKGNSCGASVGNSECCGPDDMYFEIDDDVGLLSSDESGLASYIVNVLEDTDSVFDSLPIELLDWEEPSSPSSFGISPASPHAAMMQSSESHTSFTHPPSPKSGDNKESCCQRKKSWLLTEYSKKRWSELTKRERRDVVEDISLTISQNLGLREQLEVIRIINPTASISTTDTEFVIDIDSITEEKLTKIREYVHTHLTAKQHTCDEHHKQYRSQFRKQKKNSKKQKTKNRRISKVPKQVMKKEDTQSLKEIKSGLFVREEVLSISTCESHHEDVDVLG